MLLRKAVQSLRFDEDYSKVLTTIPEEQGSRFTELANASHLTLPLALRCGEFLPNPHDWQGALQRNALRHRAVVHQCGEIAGALDAAGIQHVFLKGLTQWPYYCDAQSHRPQYDIDLYCPPDQLEAAWNRLRERGYQPLHSEADARADHLQPLLRPTSWRWRGDYFDPEMPLIVELHHRFWDPATERFSVDEQPALWDRRRNRQLDGIALHTLDPAGQLAYTAWHLVRHLLRGDLRLYHVYELAHFLERSAGDKGFWTEWAQAGQPSRRTVEGVAFRLAQDWFGCRVNPAAGESIALLPPPISRWFKLFPMSPIDRLEHPNKDELFLHFALVENPADRLRIARRRLLPSTPPRILLDEHNAAPGAAAGLTRLARRVAFTGVRAVHHIAAFAGLLRSAVRWFTWSSRKSHTSC
ncbi:MAG TPA: nucleotidyltransferase family protein [Bryobacteraceae bacterium]|nr:nucleotidyltransferase family protein [Bryobacteraceae bacterium]